MLKDYYYTDKEELDALRVENAKLKQEVENLKKQNTEIVQRICKPPVDPIAAYFDNKNS